MTRNLSDQPLHGADVPRTLDQLLPHEREALLYCLRKLGSKIRTESLFAFGEEGEKKCFSLFEKHCVVAVALTVAIPNTRK